MIRLITAIAIATCLCWQFAIDNLLVAAESRDAAIHDCIAASADRWWAVGERGLILLSEDAGRTWNTAVSDGASNLYAGIAIDERNGVVVGGSIQPYSYRSVGNVQVTQDGGRRWRIVPADGIPRLTGIQMLDPKHWIAWGDWSPTFHTAIFETRDGGVTWQGKELAASHVQSAAWKDSETGIVVDRLSRVFRFEAGKRPELLDIGRDASNPILKARYHESGWWLIGESAQIYHSQDAHQWRVKHLPGNTSDHALVRLNDIAFQKAVDFANSKSLSKLSRCWVVGSPGSVIWSSDDLGESWQTQLTTQSMPLNSITSAGSDTLFAGGNLATIVGTRNAGEGWWILGREGSRLAMLSISAVQASIPWDALTVTARETRGYAGSIVLHRERTYERAGPWCESGTRAEILAGDLGLVSLETLTSFPIDGPAEHRRPVELAVYESKVPTNDSTGMIETKAVNWIRQNRPDVIICDSIDSRDPLLQLAGRMVMTARNRAGDSRFVCFSRESGIPDTMWDCKTLLARSRNDSQTNRRKSELRFTSTTPIHGEGKLLSEILATVGANLCESNSSDAKMSTFGIHQESMPPWEQYGDYSVIFGMKPTGGKNGLVPDGIRQPGSMRTKSEANSLRYQTTVTNLQRESNLKKLIYMDVDESTRDARWHSALQQFLSSISTTSRSHSLWQIAQEARRRNQWNRWSICLELLIGEYPKEGAAELAALQKSTWSESHELRIWQEKQSLAKQAPTVASGVVSASYVSQASASPFDQRTNGESLSTESLRVASLTTVLPTGDSSKQVQNSRHPSRSTLRDQPASRIVNPIDSSSKAKVTTAVTNNVQPSFSNSASVATSRMQWDPRSVLLELSASKLKLNEVPNDQSATRRGTLQRTLDKMADWYGLYGWASLVDEEYAVRISGTSLSSGSIEAINSSQKQPNRSSSESSLVIPFSKLRPVLDGSLNDSVWKDSSSRKLVSFEEANGNDPLGKLGQTNSATTLYMIHDSRFLYVAGQCPTISRISNSNSMAKASLDATSNTRVHDEPTHESDRITMRLDIDRDFLTWYQFSIDSKGNLTDSLNDIDSWDPRWYAATAWSELGWNFELAIPLNEISDEDFVTSDSIDPTGKAQAIVWNFEANRIAPGCSVQMAKPLLTESFSPVTWQAAYIERQ